MKKYNSKPAKKQTRRRRSGGLAHVGIERRTLNSREWQGLSAAAKIFYLHLKGRYNGSNNGEIRLSYRAMQGVKGCCGYNTISAAIKELEAKDWIKIKKKGGLYRNDNFYKLTFKYDLYASAG